MPSVRVRVPASSANLGPGYDTFGLALGLYNEIEAELADAWSVVVEGEGADSLSRGADNKVAHAMASAFEHLGRPDAAAAVRCINRIPLASGLGSSSAAIVGGVVLADALCGSRLEPRELLQLAAGIEGHPDNVAAALFGGLTLCWQDERARCVPLQPSGGLAVVVVTSDLTLATSAARAVLPEQVPHADAVFNASRAGLAVAGMLLSRADLLGPGLVDRLHEPYRARLIPDLARVRDALIEAGADGAALSGAGPTVMGIISSEDDRSALRRASLVAEEATRLLAHVEHRRAPIALPIDRQGAVTA